MRLPWHPRAVAPTRGRLGAFGSIPILYHSISLMPRYSGLFFLVRGSVSVRMVVTWGQSERGEALRTERAILPGFLLCFLAFVRVPCADGQLETSQVPVQATVSSEPVKMQANAPPEGLIHLDVAATDREGKPFSGLAAKDFTLMDNGEPQKIVSFAASNEATDENERLNEVLLVLDEVNLSPAHFELVKDESIKFLRQN